MWLARIRKFAQPSDVQEPIELLRAGVLFHARGIVNAFRDAAAFAYHTRLVPITDALRQSDQVRKA